MTHEEFGRYLGLTMVLKRLVRLLPAEERTKMEQACRSIVADAPNNDANGKIASDLLEIHPHVIATLDDIFSPPKADE